MDKKRGFTLVEMLVVLAIIGMLLGISIPFTSGFGKGLRIKTASRAILGTLRVARSSAITYRDRQMVVFDAQEGAYWIQDEDGNISEKKHKLPGSIKFELPGNKESDPITFKDDAVIFVPSGAVEGPSGTITLSDKGGDSRTISIISSTGKITIQ
ncbi:MAG: GspH/FimT family pseudopilin [Candidatus Omnitrophica bacterium]|nr:GspH/FimT family pseudopilin [Candidatus Omnitrophota bacterium]MBU1933323.1 GspH/FimT family pseudopilin [Candidatus Omnitrophota bacterium]